MRINTAQTVLPLSFDYQFSFDNYFVANQAEFVISNLKNLINADGEHLIGLFGNRDSGKTHLLNACALYARTRNPGFQVYDGLQLLNYNPMQFDHVTDGTTLAIDNLDAICGHQDWEVALYQLINQCRDQKIRLIFSLTQQPKYLTCVLPDFQSRLNWGLLLELPVVQSSDIKNIVRFRARLLGIKLSDETLNYLLTHYSRQLSHQIQILRKLNQISLSTQKKITIPFIKHTLES